MEEKNRKKKKEEKKKGKKKEKGEVNKTIGKKVRRKGGEDRMKNRKEKERKKSWDQVFKNKRKYCVGTEPSAILYIGILVTSTTTGHDGSVVSASQAKGGGSNTSCGTSFFSHKYFPSSLSELSINWSDFVGDRASLFYRVALRHSLARTLHIPYPSSVITNNSHSPQ